MPRHEADEPLNEPQVKAGGWYEPDDYGRQAPPPPRPLDVAQRVYKPVNYKQITDEDIQRAKADVARAFGEQLHEAPDPPEQPARRNWTVKGVTYLRGGHIGVMADAQDGARIEFKMTPFFAPGYMGTRADMSAVVKRIVHAVGGAMPGTVNNGPQTEAERDYMEETFQLLSIVLDEPGLMEKHAVAFEAVKQMRDMVINR